MKGLINYEHKSEVFSFTGLQATASSITEAYSIWGTKCPEHIEGSFSFVLYDKDKDIFYGARDRYGIVPFYYAITNEGILYSSDLDWLSQQDGVDISPDDSTIFDYLVFNRTDHCERTFFKGIKKLLHGHCFTVKDGEMEITRWYNLKEAVGKAKPFSSPQELRECLTKVIKNQIGDNQCFAVSLSGGLDSSTIASLIVKELGHHELNTYSAVYDNEHRADESKYIKEFEPIIQNMHYAHPTLESFITEIDDFIGTQVEPCPTFSPYAQYKVLEKAKDQADFIFDGQGADEEMAGYSYAYGFYFKELLLNKQFRRLFHEIRTYCKVQHSIYCLKTAIYFLLVPNRLKTYTRARTRKDIAKEFYKKNKSSFAKSLYGSSSLQDSCINHFEFKLEHLLKWGYNNTQHWGLHGCQPFLDKEIVERLLATDNEMKLKNGYTKSILRDAMKGVMPEKIRLRTDKVGFATPQDEWLKSDIMKPLIKDIIDSESFASRTYFNVKQVRKMYEEHCNGKKNYSKNIWKWVNLELWLRKYENF